MRGIGVFLTAACTGSSLWLLSGCGEGDGDGPAVTPSGGSAEAQAKIESVRARFRYPVVDAGEGPTRVGGPVLADASAHEIERIDGWLVSRFDGATGLARLASRANEPFELTEPRSGLSVRVSIAGALPSEAEITGGYVVWSGAHESGADLLHRPIPSGTEDYLVFERAPRVAEVVYRLELGAEVTGLRLVSRTLELVDREGAPRLRMTPPVVVDFEGTVHHADVSVVGCAADTQPRAPYDRLPTAPGASHCDVRIAWDASAVRYPAVLDPVWAATDAPIAYRDSSALAVLQDGRALIAGGFIGNTATDLVEIYDPATQTWAVTGASVAPRAGPTLNLLPDGRVLLVHFGYDAGDPGAELYDPGTGTWSAANEPLGEHINHTATTLLDGRVLVVAGGSSFSGAIGLAEIFDPTTNQWSPAGTLGEARFAHEAALLPDGRVLVVGGRAGGNRLASAEIYDGGWSFTASMAVGRSNHRAVALDDGRVLVMGGSTSSVDQTANTELYDPTTAQWTAGPPMSAPRWGFTATPLSDGRVLVAGGYNGMNDLASTERFNPALSSWSSAGDMTKGRRGHTATLLDNGWVLVVGEDSAELYGDGLVGDSCSAAADCANGFCVDGFCCESACGGGDPGDCLACSIAAGSGANGSCQVPNDGVQCRPSAGPCDPAEYCDSVSPQCPADASLPDGSECDGGVCVAGVCDEGSGGAGGGGTGGAPAAGGGGSDPTGGMAASGGASAGGGGGGAQDGDGDGCSCTAGESTERSAWWVALLAIGGLVARRRLVAPRRSTSPAPARQTRSA